MPVGADAHKPGLGSGIVEALTKQLGAEIRLSSGNPGTAVAIVHDFTATLVGGLTPFAITFAIGVTGNNLVPGIYVGVAAVVSLGCLLAIRSTSSC